MAPLLARAGFAALLLAVLAPLPVAGEDAWRLPAALAAAALALAAAPPGAPAPTFLAAAAFLGLQALSLAWARDPAEGFAPALATACGLAAFAAARSVPGAADDVRRLLPAVALALAVLVVVQRSRDVPPVAAFGNSNYAGAVAAFLLPAMIGHRGTETRRRDLKKRNLLSASVSLWPILGAAGALVLLAASGSRGGLLGAVAGLSVFAVLHRPWRGRLLAAAAALLLLPLAAPQRHLGRERLSTPVVRLEVWKASLGLLARHPQGVGAGQFGAEFPPVRTEREAILSQTHAGKEIREVEDAHSSPLQVGVETGVLGAIVWAAAVVLAFARGRRRAWSGDARAAGLWAGMAGGAVAGLFNALPVLPAPVVLFGAFAGLLDPSDSPRGPAWPWRAGAAALAVAALAFLPFARAQRALDHDDPVGALAARPEWWRAHYHAGVEQARAGRPAVAAEHYRRALERRPFHAAALNNL
ncbi:MAG TPA: O-antigen ligase family protein, partial [Planctomycetota bacterium]|nr:O-antigen ligase family protein [Planctomycetota bacterium]